VAALTTPEEAIPWHEFNLDAAVKFLDHGSPLCGGAVGGARIGWKYLGESSTGYF
jgi:hypothetical protein